MKKELLKTLSGIFLTTLISIFFLYTESKAATTYVLKTAVGCGKGNNSVAKFATFAFRNRANKFCSTRGGVVPGSFDVRNFKNPKFLSNAKCGKLQELYEFRADARIACKNGNGIKGAGRTMRSYYAGICRNPATKGNNRNAHDAFLRLGKQKCAKFGGVVPGFFSLNSIRFNHVGKPCGGISRMLYYNAKSSVRCKK